MNVLVTGGAGYIGSHACVELLNAGHSVVVVDNLVNANAECLRRVERITGKTLEYHEMDLLNRAALNELFDTHRFDCVLHFAGLKAVGESVQRSRCGTITITSARPSISARRWRRTA